MSTKRKALIEPSDIARVLEMSTKTNEFSDDGDISDELSEQEDNSEGISDLETISDPFETSIVTISPNSHDESPLQQKETSVPELQDTTSSTNDSRDLREMKEVMLEIKDLLQSFLRNHNQPANCSQQAGTSTSSGMSDCSLTTPTRSKHSVSLNIRQETRRIYATLMEEEDFNGWDVSDEAHFNSKSNVSVTAHVVNEVKALNPNFSTVNIRDAAYRFFRTKKEATKNEKKGRSRKLLASRRRHERLVRKRKDRESAIRRSSKLTPEQKEKWLSILKNEFMSSEESEEDDLIVHPLPWRANHVNSMFNKIDHHLQLSQSGKSRRARKKRKIGMPSVRTSPLSAPPWAIQN